MVQLDDFMTSAIAATGRGSNARSGLRQIEGLIFNTLKGQVGSKSQKALNSWNSYTGYKRQVGRASRQMRERLTGSTGTVAATERQLAESDPLQDAAFTQAESAFRSVLGSHQYLRGNQTKIVNKIMRPVDTARYALTAKNFLTITPQAVGKLALPAGFIAGDLASDGGLSPISMFTLPAVALASPRVQAGLVRNALRFQNRQPVVPQAAASAASLWNKTIKPMVLTAPNKPEAVRQPEGLRKI